MPDENTQTLDIPCKQEARLTAIETRLENKKETIHEVHDDYYHLRDKIDIISINVAELTTILKESQKKEDLNDKKIDELTLELAKANMKIEKVNGSIDTMKWLIPVASTILTFIVNLLM